MWRRHSFLWAIFLCFWQFCKILPGTTFFIRARGVRCVKDLTHWGAKSTQLQTQNLYYGYRFGPCHTAILIRLILPLSIKEGGKIFYNYRHCIRECIFWLDNNKTKFSAYNFTCIWLEAFPIDLTVTLQASNLASLQPTTSSVAHFHVMIWPLALHLCVVK